MFWVGFWKIVLVLTLVLYTVLVIIVLFGGFKNIREMFDDFKSGA